MEALITQLLVQHGIDLNGPLTFRICSGGDINQAYRVSDGTQQWFLKRNKTALLPMFERERTALLQLNTLGGLNTPEVIATCSDAQYAYLLMHHVELQPLQQAGFFEAGEQLARCHQQTAQRFGWAEDNYIGSSQQLNAWHDDWFEFYLQQRLEPQINGLHHAGLKRLRNELGSLTRLFDSYKPVPSLLHGDLWGGNLAANSTGEPCFYDPATYYGDRETDLAMTELFGGFPPSFYQGYESVWPLHPGYRQRKPLYQLYHILNHANLFGGHYVSQAMELCQRLVSTKG